VWFQINKEKMETSTNNWSKDILPDFISNGKHKVIMHHCLLLLFLLGFILIDQSKDYTDNWDLYLKIALFVYFTGIIDLNIYVLVDKFLFKRGALSYILVICGLIIVTYLLFLGVRYSVLRPYAIGPKAYNVLDMLKHLLGFVFVFGIFVGPSTFIKLFQRWMEDNNKIHELEKTTIQSELEQLKKQVNPHFLFNMLNNVNVLTQTNPEKASQVLLRLSDLLRYQLHDSAKEVILLTADIHFITDFINLEKIRRDDFEFTISTKGKIENQLIPPLLFIPFIENATKHSLDAEKKSYIYIGFEVEDNTLSFICINSKPQKKSISYQEGGLGLTNAKRRLELLYENKHSLEIKEDDKAFQVNLNIILN